uniref:Variant surface glycoprotein 1125.5078 n=1 Tax=Trypanosoma brucei TaxID=5691 RepID=A0A1J0RBT3_9TRYP|nr:variant surface glycoprotein 1125.5078 [Trypanosoma brucei]
MAEYPAVFATNIRAHLSQQKHMMAAELKLRVYAAQHSTNKGQLFIPILAPYEEKCKNSLPAIESELGPGIDAVDATAYLSGRLLETLEFLADVHQNSGGGTGTGCLTKSGSHVVQGKADLPNCPKTRQDSLQVKTLTRSHLTDTGFVKLPTATTGHRRGAGTAKCNILGTGNSNGGLAGQQTQGQPTVLGGYIKLAANGPGYTIQDLTNLAGQDRGNDAPAFKHAYIKTKAYKPHPHKACDIKALTLDDVKNSKQAQMLYRLLIQNKTANDNQEAEQTQLQNAIETTFKPADKFQTTWIDPEIKNKVPKEAAGEEGSDQIELENEEDIDKLRRILNYYSAKAIKRELSKGTASDSNPSCPSDQKTSKKTPIKEDCKEHREKDACQDAE